MSNTVKRERTSPHAIFVQKRPAIWKCSECGKQFGPVTPEAIGEWEKSGSDPFVELERDFEKHVLEAHPSADN